MSTRGILSLGCLVAVAAIFGGCRIPIDRSVGPVIGDFSGRTGSASVGVSYQEQYTVHDAFSLSLGYANPWDHDAVAFQADLTSFGRIPEASQTTLYVGLGLGMASWTADSPTEHDVDCWLRAPLGVTRRFALDNGELFLEAALTLGLDTYEAPLIRYVGGVRWKIGL